jgi:hypothetical protein
MKNILMVVVILFLSNLITAQATIDINFNLDKQPVWGPAGYDYVEYYYLPDIETYYSVPQQRYYYYEKGGWRNSSNLPSRLAHYKFYDSYKVVVNEKNPWRNHKKYKVKYLDYKNRNDQKFIRDSRDARYFVIKNHPEHNNWVKKQKTEKEEMKKANSNHKKNGKSKNKK